MQELTLSRRRKLQALAGTMPISKIAAELGETEAQIRSWGRQHKIRFYNQRFTPGYWTPAEDAEMDKMLERGFTAPEIAEAMGRTVASVRNRAKSIGLSLRQTGEKHHRAKYTDEDVRLSVALLLEGLPASLVAEKMEIPVGLIRSWGKGKYRSDALLQEDPA